MADKLEAGTYLLRRNMTPNELVDALLVSRELAVTVGLREGLRLEQITAKLETLPLTMDVKAFYDEVKNPPKSLLADYPWLDLPKGASLEGYLAPATYRVLPDVTPDTLIRQMLDKFYADVGPDRLKVAKTRGLTFYQVLTLASLVEREAFLDAERPQIAGVYQNRLSPHTETAGFLGSDPSIFYVNDSMQLARIPIPIGSRTRSGLRPERTSRRRPSHPSSPPTTPTPRRAFRPARSPPRPSPRSMRHSIRTRRAAISTSLPRTTGRRPPRSPKPIRSIRPT